MLSIGNEFDPLQHVILGTGIGMKPLADPVLQQERLPFDCVPSTGGSFRCATLPLRRG